MSDELKKLAEAALNARAWFEGNPEGALAEIEHRARAALSVQPVAGAVALKIGTKVRIISTYSSWEGCEGTIVSRITAGWLVDISDKHKELPFASEELEPFYTAPAPAPAGESLAPLAQDEDCEAARDGFDRMHKKLAAPAGVTSEGAADAQIVWECISNAIRHAGVGGDPAHVSGAIDISRKAFFDFAATQAHGQGAREGDGGWDANELDCALFETDDHLAHVHGNDRGSFEPINTIRRGIDALRTALAATATHAGAQGGMAPMTFDEWSLHPYTKVLQESIDKDYVPKAPAAQTQPAPRVGMTLPKIAGFDRGFRWDCEKLQHVPTLVIEFAAVPAGQGNDAQGWVDRDALANLLAPTKQEQSEGGDRG